MRHRTLPQSSRITPAVPAVAVVATVLGIGLTALPAAAQQVSGPTPGMRYLSWGGKTERPDGANGAPAPTVMSGGDGMRRPAPIIPRQVAVSADTSAYAPRYPGIGAPRSAVAPSYVPARANALTPASAWLRGAATSPQPMPEAMPSPAYQPAQPQPMGQPMAQPTPMPGMAAQPQPQPQPLRQPAYRAAAAPAPTSAPTTSFDAPVTAPMSAVPTDGAYSPLQRRQVAVYPLASAPVGAQGQAPHPEFYQPPVSDPAPVQPMAPAPSPIYDTNTATPAGVMPAATVAADPMAPRRDAPIFRMQQSAPPAAALSQQAPEEPAPSASAPRAQGASQTVARQQAPQEPLYAPTGPGPAREGPRYYSVHRAAGHQPDATAMPESVNVYLESASVDLAEPQAQPLPSRVVNGRVQAIVPNEDPTLP